MACFAFEQLAQNTKDKEKKGTYMFYHKSFGLLTLGLLAPRIMARLAASGKIPPPFPVPTWQEIASKISHATLYGMMIFMPVSGVAMGYFGGKGLPFFVTTLPGAEKPKGNVAKGAYQWHKRVGYWFQYAVVPIHIGAVAFHALKGQNVLRRMIAVA